MRYHVAIGGSLKGLLSALLLLLVGTGCGGPNTACIAECQRRNDTCLLQSTTSAAVQACGQHTAVCMEYCR